MSGGGTRAEIGPARERARAFVAAHGDPLERLLADTLTGRVGQGEFVAALEAELGGGVPASVASALRALRFLDDARALRAPLCERVCGWVVSVQSDGGSFGDSDALTERRVATGMLAGHLAKAPFARPETLDAACDWLADRVPRHVEGDAWPLLAAYAHGFANVPHDASDVILQWCGRGLDRGYRAGQVDAVRVARAFCWCDAACLPGASLDARELVEAILVAQRPDGGWNAPDGESEATHSLDALVSLTRFS